MCYDGFFHLSSLYLLWILLKSFKLFYIDLISLQGKYYLLKNFTHCSEVMVESFRPHADADLSLVINGNVLRVNTNILKRESPVKFAVMLQNCSFNQEERQLELALPQDTTRDDIVQLLNCVNPELNRPVTEQNVLGVLPVAEFFGMENRKKMCSGVIKRHVIKALDHQTSLDISILVKYLIICEKYSDISGLDKAMKLAARMTFDDLQSSPLFDSVSDEVKEKIQKWGEELNTDS